MNKKPTYVRCPRCELNYIKKGQKQCSVCTAELNSRKDDFNIDSELEICPICKANYISGDESMCSVCMSERDLSDENLEALSKDEWNEYVNEDEDELSSEEEELGPMASVTNIEDELLADIGVDMDLDLTIDEELTFDEIDELAKDEFDEEFKATEEEFEEEDDDFDDDFDDDLDDDDDEDFEDDDEE